LNPSLKSYWDGVETQGKEVRKGNEDAQIRNEKHLTVKAKFKLSMRMRKKGC